MACKPIHKMPVRERAKQFMPFSPLKGLEEAIKRKEQERLMRSRAILSADAIELLNQKMQDIYEGDLVTITHYEGGIYTTVSGEIEEINLEKRCFKIKEKTVFFGDVFDISKV